ncbi:uncharacterized protein N0V89_005522 [Didymosphaeria variabile]|uniref:Major facilitator superfamily (MFS) profile domain-containing protein n=1 Tax=Didymosphaeria variabile TaxID=1932322 RepID=A0A9W8XNP4_9PLEO|nr:uncharacterized protein N0V89_005522 [Didymosphaeria variabile]KAJ4353792.1 hypothetical protein N0V89_005522 [Didymosphaeria variabile]
MGSPAAVPVETPDIPELEKGVLVRETNTIEQTANLIVSWDGPSDPSNPYNWSASRKWATTLLTSLGGLVTLMSGPMLAPALDAIGSDLHISQAEASMALSIYILAFALMAGLGASAEFAVSGAIVADCFNSDERGKSIAVRSFLPLLGPAIGPIVGGVMVQQVSWRWLFYTLSIFAALLVILFALFLPETHAQTLLSRKAARLRKETGKSFYAEKDVSSMTIAVRLKITTLRPTIMLCTQPVIQLAAFLMGYQFGLLYIFHATFASMWIERYEQSHTASGLHYFAIVTGCLSALLIEWWAMDAIWARLKARNGGVARPENRVPLMVPGTLLFPVGLLIYGWAAQQRVHWIVVDIGAVLLGCGYLLSTTAVQSYVIEAYLDHTASGAAAAQLPRNVFAFAFPIFAPSLYDSLGYGLGNTTLAGIAVLFGIPAPYILWRYGESLRKRGKAVE